METLNKLFDLDFRAFKKNFLQSFFCFLICRFFETHVKKQTKKIFFLIVLIRYFLKNVKVFLSSSCRFKLRLLESRIDHKTESAMRDGTLIDSFSYVILEKGKRSIAETPSSRVLEVVINLIICL